MNRALPTALRVGVVHSSETKVGIGNVRMSDLDVRIVKRMNTDSLQMFKPLVDVSVIIFVIS